MTPQNFLFLEPLIKAALRARLDPHVHVLSASDLEGVAEASQPTPAVHVLYRGMSVRRSGMGTAEIDQHWHTVVVVRNLRDMTGAEDARQDAGPLAIQVVDTLLGRELDAAGALAIATPAQPGFRNGHFYLPLGWIAPITLERTQCLD